MALMVCFTGTSTRVQVRPFQRMTSVPPHAQTSLGAVAQNPLTPALIGIGFHDFQRSRAGVGGNDQSAGGSGRGSTRHQACAPRSVVSAAIAANARDAADLRAVVPDKSNLSVQSTQVAELANAVALDSGNFV